MSILVNAGKNIQTIGAVSPSPDQDHINLKIQEAADLLPKTIQSSPTPPPSTSWGLRSWFPFNQASKKNTQKDEIDNNSLEKPNEKKQDGLLTRFTNGVSEYLSPSFEIQFEDADIDFKRDEARLQLENQLESTPKLTKDAGVSDRIQNGFGAAFQAVKTTAENVGNVAWNVMEKVSENPIIQGLAAFSAGSPISNLADHEGLDEVGHAAGNLAQKAGDIAWNLLEAANESSVIQGLAAFSGGAAVNSIDQERFVMFSELAGQGAVKAGEMLIENGYGDHLVEAFKYFASTDINIEDETINHLIQLLKLTGSETFPKLLLDLCPNVILEIDKVAKEKLTLEQLKLWENNKLLVLNITHWMITTGTVKLFIYMEEHPLPQVKKIALEKKLNKSDELACYLFHFFSPKIATIEKEIQKNLDEGSLKLSEDPKERISQLKTFFNPIVKEFVTMSVGDTSKLSAAHNLIIEQIQSSIVNQMIKHFKIEKGTRSLEFEHIDLTHQSNDLRIILQNPEMFREINTVVEDIAKKLAAMGVESILDKLKSYPALIQYLTQKSQLQSYIQSFVHAILLKVITQHIKTCPAHLDKTLTPANIVEILLGAYVKGFKEAMPKVERARKIVDESQRNKKLRKIFRPLATELFNLIGNDIPFPFPSFTKDIFEQKVLGEIIPDLLAQQQEKWISRYEDYEKSKTKLNEILPGNHAVETSRVIAAMIGELIPHSLISERETFAGLMMKTAREQLTNLRLDNYIQDNKEALYEVVSKHIAEQNTPNASTQNDLNAYIKNNKAVVRNLVINHLKSNGEEQLLKLFEPSAEEVHTYLTANQEKLKGLLEKNLQAIGQGQAIKDLMAITTPIAQAVILKTLANIYEEANKIDGYKDKNGLPTVLPKLGLRFLNVAAEYIETINKIFIRKRVHAIHRVSHEELIREFGDKLHEGVPRSPEALEARKRLIILKEKDSRDIKSLKQAKTRLKSAQNRNRLDDIKLAEANLDRIRARRAATKREIKKANDIIDPVRKANMVKVLQGILEFAKMIHPDDLIPSELKTGLLPDLGVTFIKKAVDEHTINLCLDKILKIVEDVSNDGGLERLVYDPPEDETQRLIDLALGRFLLLYLKSAPISATYAIFQLKDIREGTAGALGSLFRQKLGHDLKLLELIDNGLKSLVPNLAKGEWNVDENNQPKFQGLNVGDPNEVQFNIAKTIEEIEAEDIKLDQERKDVKRNLNKQLGKTVSSQMKNLIKGKQIALWESILKSLILLVGGELEEEEAAPGKIRSEKTHHGLWLQLHETIEEKIEESFLGDFGLTIKELLDNACRFFLFTMIGSVLKAICPPIANSLWWIFEQVISWRCSGMLKSLRMEITETLWLELIDNAIEILNNPNDSDATEEVNAALQNAQKWTEQNEELIRIGEQDAYVSKAKREIIRLRQELSEAASQPNTNFGRLSHMAQELMAYVSHADRTPLVGNAIPLKELPVDNPEIMKGYEILSETYGAVKIKGDGHCLFRAVGTGIFMNIVQEGEAAKRGLSEKIANYITNQEEFVTFNEIMDSLFHPEQPMSVQEVMSEKVKSDLIVKILREVACKFNQANPKQVKDIIQGIEGMTLEQYFEAMASMTQHKMGDEPEIAALAKALDIPLKVLNVRAIGNNEQGISEYNTQNREGDEKTKVALLFASEHYNLAISKAFLLQDTAMDLQAIEEEVTTNKELDDGDSTLIQEVQKQEM